MCLTVIIILGLQTILLFLYATSISINYYSFSLFKIYPLFNTFCASFLLVLFLWITIRKILKKTDQLAKANIELLKWKRNPSIFLSLLKLEQKINATIWKDDIILGSVHASLKIIIVSNPYCQPCANAHKELLILLERYENEICVVIRFSTQISDISDRRYITLSKIFTVYHSSPNKHIAEKSLHDWFEYMNLTRWEQKWNPIEENNQESLIEKSSHWCRESGVAFTPTFFINGFKLPEPYSIKDMNLLTYSLLENISALPLVE